MSKKYTVKEIYYTLQGEGAHAGRPAVFCRFTGCNLWTGREQDREKAICRFCDTDFIGTDGLNGGKYTAQELAEKVRAVWENTIVLTDIPIHKSDARHTMKGYVVCTGGEPALQLDSDLISALHEQNMEVGIETNGTIELPEKIDWVCVSPKAGSNCIVTSGDELKLVFPQVGAEPELFVHQNFKNFYLQPMDGAFQKINSDLAVQYCLAHPQWRLSVQTHKYLNIP